MHQNCPICSNTYVGSTCSCGYYENFQLDCYGRRFCNNANQTPSPLLLQLSQSQPQIINCQYQVRCQILPKLTPVSVTDFTQNLCKNLRNNIKQHEAFRQRSLNVNIILTFICKNCNKPLGYEHLNCAGENIAKDFDFNAHIQQYHQNQRNQDFYVKCSIISLIDNTKKEEYYDSKLALENNKSVWKKFWSDLPQLQV